jgi:two-component system OmpR family sensor kinase
VERVPLWARLVAVMLGLVAAAQVVTGVGVFAALDHDLSVRLDKQLISSAQATARRLYRADVGPEDLARLDLPGLVYVRQVLPDGTVEQLFADPDTKEAPPRIPAGPEVLNTPRTVGATSGDGRWRMVAEPIRRPDGDATLYMAVRLDSQAATVTKLAVLDLVVSGAVLALLAGVGYVLVRASLRPLREVETVAAAISAGQLGERVPAGDTRTETGRLAQAFNTMLTHIERAFVDREAAARRDRASEERMRRFVTDASHELRTPLTSIRGFAELYRQGAAADRSDVDRYMRHIETESSRMALLVEDLLLLARLDQRQPLSTRPIDLAALATDAVRDARASAPDRHIELHAGDGPLTVAGDEPRLRRVVGSLVSNAVTHTPPGTPVTVRVAPDGKDVVLEVADAGPGMTPDQAGRVFDRFYRADPARGRQTGGSGLGLAVADAIVAAHGGAIDVDTAPGMGTTFRVRLPAAQARRPDPAPGPAGDPVRVLRQVDPA